MADALTRAEVERIAALAHLELTEDEIVTFTRQLGQVLEYARQVQTLDTGGIAPTAHVLAGDPLDRADEPRASLAREEVLAAAPDASTEPGLFRVPRVIG